MACSLALIEDHAVVRTALRLLVERVGDVHVVGEAADGEAGLHLIASARPEVALVDIALPKMSGLALAEEVARRDVPTRILFLTAYENPAYLVRALEIGALGYVPKSASEHELLSAIHQVASGLPYVPPSLATSLVAAVRTGGGSRSLSPLSALTARERQVLDLVISGRNTGQIAGLLQISPHTVHRHRSAIMRKMGFHDRVDLVRYALANDLAGHADPEPANDPVAGKPYTAEMPQ
jgi:DNA-binding NarL/FixJ family response regulator